MLDVSVIRRNVTRLVADRDRYQEELVNLQANTKTLKTSVANHTAALQALMQIGKVHRKISLGTIEELVTASLQAVFPERAYSFELRPDEKRNQVELQLLIKEGTLELDPVDEMGGSVVDVVSLALRVVLWSRAKNRTDPVMILDEPARMVARAHIGNLALMLKTLSERLGIQFIIVTHVEELAYNANRSFLVTKKEYSVVKESVQ